MFTTTRVIAAATALTMGFATIAPAQAYWHRGGYYHHGYYRRGPGLGVGLAAGAAVGLLAGAAIASRPVYPAYPAYAPPPVVYAPAPPVIYAAPPPPVAYYPGY